MPLERAISKLGLAGRTEARALILGRRVSIDGKVVTNPATAVVPERIQITIDGAKQARPSPITVLLHKPRGVVTTRSDPQGRQTVFDLLTARESHLVITLTEGKNREVRRLLEAAGHPVTRLRRAQYGGLEIGTLAPGGWRQVSAAEIARAFPGWSQVRKREPKPK